MKSQFKAEVFPAELEEIIKRRRDRKLACPDPLGPPSVSKGLVGLALSGGGIRSATVSLGVIQGLVGKKCFHLIDYLSTVSGGGYIGSCLSSVLNHPGASETDFEDIDGAADTPAVKHLRNSCDYLVAGTAVDKMRVPMILLRGLLLNLWLIVPALILAVFFTELLTELWHMAGAPVVSPLLICAPFLVLALLFPPVIRVFGGSFSWKMRNFYERSLATLFVLSIIGMILVPILWLVGYCIDNNWEGRIRKIFETSTGADSLLHAGIVIGIIVAIFVLARIANTVPGLTRFIINSIFAVIGPLTVFSAYLLLCIFFVESPYFTDAIEKKSVDGEYTKYSEILDSLANLEPAVVTEESHRNLNELIRELAINKLKVHRISENEKLKIRTVQAPGTAKKTWVLSIGDNFKTEIRSAGDYLYLPEKSLFNLYAEWQFYGAGIVILILNLFLFDANVTSTHGFYRDRLSRAFLIRKTKADATDDHEIEANDEQKLSELNANSNVAPYHLINTTLNLPNSNDPELRGRKSDFFMLSKRFCGSERTGYCKTTDIETADHNFNLGTAMAISAAAAAPNMGTETRSYFVFIMTLLNLRLGYWFPNPAKIIPAGRLKKFLWPNVGPRYLFREAMGKLDDKYSHVNLSDGGHIENLAIYQLLKRRCKLIIAVDAEADPDASFGGLVTLIRFANIDLGIRIDMELEEMQRNESGVSLTQWKLATIHYGNDASGTEETGHLLYLKSSLMGDENEYIKAYRAANPSFPHETTADQFFDEAQFEVYRSLGEHIARKALEDTEVQKQLAIEK